MPVPLDAATIGDATLCAPLVIKRDGDSLICSILPSAAMDSELMCSGPSLKSPCFQEAISRADFDITAKQHNVSQTSQQVQAEVDLGEVVDKDLLQSIQHKDNAVIINEGVKIPKYFSKDDAQIIKFSTGLEFQLDSDPSANLGHQSSVVLPCAFGTQLEGPVLLATGTLPKNVPFGTSQALLDYYQQRKNVVFVVNDSMMDNARSLATSYRMNAVFIVQLELKDKLKTADDVLSALNAANVNAVTAHAGPLSLVLVQVSNKYYFYRGIANRDHLNTSKVDFGADVTSIVESAGIYNLLEQTAPRIINLAENSNKVLLPGLQQFVTLGQLQDMFKSMAIEGAGGIEEDIHAAVTQLQVLLNHKDLQDLSKGLIATLTTKISDAVAPLRDEYLRFFTEEFDANDKDSVKKKGKMLGELRSTTKEAQKTMAPLITAFSNMLSTQTTSKRTHDLKRLARQAAIHSNVDAAKSMTFETLAGYLEDHAGDMGVLLLNINTTPYERLLGNIRGVTTDVR